MEPDLVKLMQALIDVAEGRAPADLVFVNASIVDVYRLRVARGQVAVKFGCIAGVLFEAFMRERQPHWLTAVIYVAMGWLVVFRLPQLVAALRERHPEIPIIATGGPKDETIRKTIAAGANAITYTPPDNGVLLAEIMHAHRERYR